MKKFILGLILVMSCVFVFAQDAATPVIDPAFFDQLWQWATGYVPAKTLTVILTIAYVLEYVVTYVKWIPANSTLALIWNGFKKVVGFLSGKKK